MPEDLKKEVADFVAFLKQKGEKTSADQKKPGKRQFGSMKGQIWMADDFDAPLEDFKEYM